nr:MAG TPA: hypothetical protein [Caudoviricetes sp.]
MKFYILEKIFELLIVCLIIIFTLIILIEG